MLASIGAVLIVLWLLGFTAFHVSTGVARNVFSCGSLYFTKKSTIAAFRSLSSVIAVCMGLRDTASMGTAMRQSLCRFVLCSICSASSIAISFPMGGKGLIRLAAL
jgi:hypothetical protein